MKSIFMKATAIVALCIVVVVIVMSLRTYSAELRLARTELAARGAMLTDLTGHDIGGAIRFAKTEVADSMISTLMEITKDEVTEAILLNKDGSLFYHHDSADGLVRLDEMMAAGRHTLSVVARASDEGRKLSHKQELYYAPDGLTFAHPAYFGSDAQIVGAIVIRVSDAPVLAAINDETQGILRFAAISLVIAVAVAAFMFRHMISRPLNRLNQAVASVAEGDYTVEVPSLKAKDEIGDIARALKGFRDGLEASVEVTREAMFKGSGFQGASAALVITDTSFKILYANPAAKKLLENHFPSMTTGAIAGKSALGFDPALQKLAQAAKAGLPQTLSLTVGAKMLDVLTDAVRDPDGKLNGYILEWQSTTQMRRNATVLSSIDAGQIRAELSPTGQVETANQRFATLLGGNIEATKGRDIAAMTSLADSAAPDLWATLRQGKSVQGLVRFAQGAGNDALIDANFSPIRDDQGVLRSIHLLGTDVTLHQAAIAESEKRRREMETAQARVVEHLRSALSRLSEGDLTCAITESFSNDYERLRIDFNEAANRLRSALSDVVTSSLEIRNEVTEISSAAENLSRRTEQQAATLEQTAAALDQMTNSVKSTAEVASHANDKVDEAKRNAESSGRVVGEAVAAMSEIEQSSTKISRITSVIDEIAFQTNLLALNAGVEAARAGEAGRGFAVVASEVRDLAQRSSEAAREIAGLITASSDQVKRGVSLVAEAGRSLTGIQSAVGEIHGLVSTIANSAQEQSNGIAELNTAVKHLDQVTQQNAAMFEETTAASQSLNRAAVTLSNTTQHFQIGQDSKIAPVREQPRKPKEQAPAKQSQTAKNWGMPKKEEAKLNFHSSRKASTTPRTETNGTLAMQSDANEGWEDF